MAEQVNKLNVTPAVPAAKPVVAPAAAPIAPKPVPVNPLDVKAAPKQEGPSLVQNIVSTQNAGGGGLLGAAPTIDRSLLDNMAPPKSNLLTGLKIGFGVLLFVSVASLIFFTSQLGDRLDFASTRFNIPNASQKLASTNEEIITLKNDLNVLTVLQMKASLDKFSHDGDAYIQNYDISHSQTASSSDRARAEKALSATYDDLRDSFIFLREKALGDFTAAVVDAKYNDPATLASLYDQELRLSLNQKADAIGDSLNEQARRDQRNYRQAIKLVGNPVLPVILMSTDFDSLSDEELYDLIKIVNFSIVNDLSLIQTIKETRVKWSDIINEIELKTIAVDSHYTEDFYDELGGIRYTSYDFDSANGRISIIGETKKFDTTNFTLIANLIESLNDSDFFENADMRSFSKSGSLDDGYLSTLKITVDLQKSELFMPESGEAEEGIPGEDLPEDFPELT